MDGLNRRRWLRVALLVGAVYLVAGVGFGALAGQAASHEMRVTWRLAAWAISAVAFVAHIASEHLRQSPPASTGLHTALAVALGAFGLAVAATLHARAGAGHFPASALVLWPLLTALPAFGVAFVAGLVFARLWPPPAESRGAP